MVEEIEQPAVRPLHVFDDEYDGQGACQMLEETPPGGEQVSPLERSFRGTRRSEKSGQSWPEPLPLCSFGDLGVEPFVEAFRHNGLRIGFHQPQPHPDDLGQRPVSDSLAVRQTAPDMPVDGVREPVEVLEELPRQSGFADAGQTGDKEKPSAALLGTRVKQLLEHAQLAVAADKRRLHRISPLCTTATGNDALGAEHVNRFVLALERTFADVDACNGRAHRPPRVLVDQDRAGFCDRLHARSGIYRVAGNHALAGCADGHRGFTGDDSSTRLQPIDAGVDT